MLYLASEQYRRTSFCPHTNLQHGPALNRWTVLSDGSQLSQEAIDRDHADLLPLLTQLNDIPGEPFCAAIVVDGQFKNGVCRMSGIPGGSCFNAPARRKYEVVLKIPHRDGGGLPATKCLNCIAKIIPAELDSLLHRINGTVRPPEPPPPVAPIKSAEEIKADRLAALKVELMGALHGYREDGKKISLADRSQILIDAWQELAEIDAIDHYIIQSDPQ